MKNYYYLHFDDETGEVAYPENDTDLEFIEDIVTLNELPFSFKVNRLSLQDYQPNNLSWLLFSEELYKLIDQFISEAFKWVSTSILIDNDSKNNKDYFILCPQKDMDLLHPTKTLFAKGGFVVKAILDKKKAEKYDVIILPGSSFRLIVSQKVKDLIEKKQLSGIVFSKALVA